MKHRITQILSLSIVADHTMARVVQVLCFVVSIFVLTLSLWKLGRLDLTEAQMFLGVLLSAIMPLHFVVIGLLMPLAVAPKNAK
jgi:hypothetical protein